MSVVRANLLPWLSSLVIALSVLMQPAYAADVWEGVFAYQKKMADYGNPEAQVKLGEMYEEGHGTEQDYAKARQWYQKAADQGFAAANKKLQQLEARKQREAEAKKRAEQERIAREKAEKERVAREKAEAEEKARQAQLEKERKAREAEQQRQAREKAARAKEQAAMAKEDKARKEEEERKARQRAKEAMKKMLATPSAYTED